MNLSLEQKTAVEYILGPQIVLAGPGSGKTLVIVEKAAFLAERLGYKPDQVLILTYNTMTADELNTRLRKREHRRPLPEARTFHSYGQRIIQQHFQHLGYKSPPEVANEFRKYRLRRQAYFQAADIPPGLAAPDNVIAGVNAFISRANDELVSPNLLFAYIKQKRDDFREIADADRLAFERKALDELQFAARFYEIYNRLKIESDLIDFDDMLFGLYRIFLENSEVLAAERYRLKYILVDEFQDANSGQVETLALLGRNAGKICVVGDDDQSIYRFRGASYGSFVNFNRYFPQAVTHKLTVNFRSTPSIVAGAQALISYKTQQRFDPDKIIRSNAEEGDKIGVFISPDGQIEAQRVCRLIQDILDKDAKIAPDNIAVISRTHEHRREIRNTLTKAMIPIVDQRPVSIFSIFETHLLASFLRGALADDEPDWLFPILLKYCPGLGPNIYARINESLKSLNPYDILQNLGNDEDIRAEDKSGLVLAGNIIKELRTQAVGTSPARLVEKALALSGMLIQAVAEGDAGDIKARALSRFWSAATEFEDESAGDIREFLNFIIWAQQTESLTLEPSTEKGVHLLTAHSAKGLEFPVVIVIGLAERKFPQQEKTDRFVFPQELSKELPPPDDAYYQEERRLMYVGMTRAARQLYLSGLSKPRVKISRFFAEVISKDDFDRFGYNIKFAAQPVFSDKNENISLDVVNTYEIGMGEILKGILHGGQSNLESGFGLLIQKMWQVSNRLPDQVSVDNFKRSLIDIINNSRLEEPRPVLRLPSEEKPRLSYTDIRIYGKCPLQYRFKKILRIPERAGPQMHLGDAIHRTLQEAMAKAGNQIKPTADELKGLFLDKWQKYRHSDLTWMESLKRAGLEMLEKFAEREQSVKTRVMALEKDFRIDRPEFVLAGRIDRVDIDEAGEIYVIDYKTGKIGMPESSYESKKDDQLIVYAMVCPELFGKLPAEVAFYYLAENKLISSIVSQKDIDSLHSKIGEIAGRIAAGDFTATPSPFECGQCSYRNICPFKAQ